MRSKPLGLLSCLLETWLLKDLDFLWSILSFFRWGHFFKGVTEDHLKAHSLFEQLFPEFSIGRLSPPFHGDP